MKILGIDPSLSCLGWGVIQFNSPKINYIHSGIIKTRTDTKLHIRLSNIADSIEQVIMEISSKRLGATAVAENKSILGIITDGDLRRMIQSEPRVAIAAKAPR